MASVTNFHQLHALDAKKKDVDFSIYKGKVVLVVNVASLCSFAPQYKGLQALYEKYNSNGLEILGFPCNQFKGQEPKGNDEIVEFCSRTYNVNFTIMDKVDVNGDNTHPVYEWLKSQKSWLGLSRIKWNFEKFLIDKEGKVYSRYASTSGPDSIESDIRKLLDK